MMDSVPETKPGVNARIDRATVQALAAIAGSSLPAAARDRMQAAILRGREAARVAWRQREENR
jgi:hypothetical protein